MDYVEQLKRRRRVRRLLGREYYIVKRKLSDRFGSIHWAKQRPPVGQMHPIMEHRSLILRPLRDVEMYLQENKRTNLRLAIAHLHGTLIAPGETLSVWHMVGRPTARKGYLEGLILNQGHIDKGIGGGLCQLGNLLFWLFAHTPLTLLERHRHSFDVFPDVNRSIPFGAGATLSYNYIDYRVANNTDETYYLELWLDDTHLNGRISASAPLRARYSVEERNHRIVGQPWGGYTRHNQIVQVITFPDGSTQERLLTENHAVMMYHPILPESSTAHSPM